MSQEPTYTPDIVGDIEQWDERDILFARQDLFVRFGPQSPQYQTYYAAHPERLEYDRRTAAMPGLGRHGGVDAPMFEAQFDVIRQIAHEESVDCAPARPKTVLAPQRASTKIKAFARLIGADLVGIGPLRQEWVYSHSGRSFGDKDGYRPWGAPIDLRRHSTAIALGLRMDSRLLQSAPGFPTLLATARGYAAGAWVSVQLARYIRGLGYAARAHHLYNYQVLCVPVAVDCGLGELSRAGYLLNKELGLGLRLAVVSTEMPLAHDPPVDIGVQSYCETCQICAEECPIEAIPRGDKVVANGVRKWKLDEEKCYRYWHAAGSDCGLCMVACPWTRPRAWLHRIIAEAASRKGPHQAWLTGAHRLVYGRHRSAPGPAFLDPPQTQGTLPNANKNAD